MSSSAAFSSPFQRLASLLHGKEPGKPPINLTVGEPRHAVPAFVGPALQASLGDFNRYPAIKGTDAFRATVAAWLDRRFALNGAIDPETMVLPLNGSREGLFFAALEARRRLAAKTDRPAVLLPNPFYQAYAAGAVGAGCEPILLPAGPETGFLPDLDAVDPAMLARAVAVYFASPANPQGAVADLASWTRLIEAARRHDFYLFADECYSEIYRGEAAPIGVLSAALATGSFNRVVTFNSLSKRSNLAGLRVGIAAGDPDFLVGWTAFRNMAAPQVPMPSQAVAVAAFNDEAHVIENRRLYDAKYVAAERWLSPLFGPVTPPGGFFLWLDVGRFGGGVVAAERLWREAGVRVVPGGYLAADGPDGANPGAAYVRLALVETLEITESALARVAETFR